jgi:hypothetical protein
MDARVLDGGDQDLQEFRKKLCFFREIERISVSAMRQAGRAWKIAVDLNLRPRDEHDTSVEGRFDKANV